jgi:hypothetical protein
VANYPIANAWVTLPVVTVTTTPAQVITQAQIDALHQAGFPEKRLMWIEYYADAPVLRGGKPNQAGTNTPAADYIPLPTGLVYMLEANKALGQYLCTASGTATVRVNLGFGE